ncbi:MAG: hypothetical protein WCR67_07895, partial [Bacilli bacterium]
DYVYKNGEIEVVKSEAIASIDFSNDSKNEKDFFETIKPYFNRKGTKFRIENNVPLTSAIKSIKPEDINIIGNKELDVIVQASEGFFNRKYRTIAAFEIDGGEHIGSKKTIMYDREKEKVCRKYNIKLIRIPNNSVKDYVTIISIFESFIDNSKDFDETQIQMSLFEN